MHTASGNVVLRGKDGKNVLVEDLAIMGQDDATAVNVVRWGSVAVSA